MKILITGGGFLGAWIAQKLVQGEHCVRVFSRSPSRPIWRAIVGKEVTSINWRCGDIRNGEEVIAAAENCDAIIHLAALLSDECRQEPVGGAQVNVLGTLNVFLAARENRISKLLYASSGGVFDNTNLRFPYPTTLYGTYKLANEGTARAFYADYRISSIGFRPFVIYGPGRETGITASPTLACRAAAEGKAYTIPIQAN
ncbi:NAD-dependent epimerase/dehydratase family protein [Rhizobium mongolense]|uniref:NAD-dependent epimerase/dehydratase family protein n=1 Tax=Rhizobium mongolense TaxID=57676 RepID=UPI0034A1744E